MPLIIQQHLVSGDSVQRFARVLSDQPQTATRLAHADANTLLIEAIFNGQPVAILLGSRQDVGCRIEALGVHPATRGRGVYSELLRKGSPLLPNPIEWAEPVRTLAKKFLTPA